MKYLLTLIVVVSFSYLKFYNLSSYKSTEVTITIPALNNLEIMKHLENELNKERTVDYIDGSLLTNTIVIKVNENTFSKKKIDNILHKWGCEANDYYYRKLNEFSLN